jgi:hypothetical protein
MSGGPKLTHKQHALIVALIAQPTIEKAAAVAGISEATAGRWLKDPAFREAYTAARRENLSEALALLRAAMLDAITTLRTMLADPEVAAQNKVIAARILIEQGLRSFETDDLERRIAVVEAALETNP